MVFTRQAAAGIVGREMSSRSWSGVLCVLAGCLVQNPAYDLEGSGTGSGGGSTGTSTGPATDAGSSSSGSGAGSGTGGELPCQFDGDCADGLFCNGAEVCDPASQQADPAGCAPGALPCGPDMTCSEQGGVCVDACQLDADADDDGVPGMACGGLDCDDGNPGVFPGQTEVCDLAGVDEDCDPATLGGLDADADGFISNQCCQLGGNGLVCGDDCDDALPGVGAGDDWAHCGSCGVSCSAQQTCTAGACVGARRVFTTSTLQAANFGGLAGADALCQARAGAAALGGMFKAFMVDDKTGLERLDHPQVPFVRLDGVKVADDWADLADKSLDAPFAVDEFRQPVGNNAWTGLRDVDGGGISSCNNWTFAGGECLMNGTCGGAGETNKTDDHWDGFYIFDCNSNFRVYCIEQ